jgi:predicted phage-related endonuclease
VYQVASQLPKIEERQAAIEKSLDDEREAVKAQSAKMDQMFRTLQRICSNTAKTGEDRQRCFD